MKIEEVKTYLLKAKDKNKIQNNYIIYGGDKNQREEIALFLSGILNCENEKFCEKCDVCKKIVKKIHPDIRWIIPEKSILSIDEVREVKKDIFIKPYFGKYKIYIFEITYIKEESSSAFLKVLEEPPEYGIILILCPNINFLLPTIISRCFKIYLNYKIPEYVEEIEKTVRDFFELVDFVRNKKFFEFFHKIDLLCKNKEREEIENWIENILFFLRDSLFSKMNFPEKFLINKNSKKEKFEFNEISLLEKIWNIKQKIRYNINTKIAVENVVFQIFLSFY
ncbi:MAG: hypothetical protein NC915_05895 [Candidatus Omnitrophica bacterium]|nr:hypothetical protein [Candidatus Omnitrophota bacterium]